MRPVCVALVFSNGYYEIFQSVPRNLTNKLKTRLSKSEKIIQQIKLPVSATSIQMEQPS